jgi:hypothetical protein
MNRLCTNALQNVQQHGCQPEIAADNHNEWECAVAND